MTTNAERQAAYKERMRKAGYQQVTLWIQSDRKEILADFAKDLSESPIPHSMYWRDLPRFRK